MVAYTEDWCLPYLEGTDSPCLNTGTVCEPSNAWCDLARRVDDQLNVFDSLVSRTAVAVPMASISYAPTIPTTVGAIPFDIVNFDTDDMVNFDQLRGVTPQRDGVYVIRARVLLDEGVVNTQLRAYIDIGTQTSPGLGTIDAMATGTARSQSGIGSSRWVFASMTWAFTPSTPIPRSITVVAFNPLTPTNTREAHLDVYWHSEL